ncbi:hypothetical protein FGB90_14495 [Alteribacter natronophilus]|nr:hypothetical protein FGB90_14495 [Alteribacter natronophilus]
MSSMRWMKPGKKHKLTVFLRRVSSEQQNLDMQIAADKKYREKLHEEDYVVLNEEGVSANKLSIPDREEMVKLIGMIKSNQVERLYVYDRTRLTRKFFEYLELIDMFREHNVKVTFTTEDAGYMPFNNDLLIEGFSAILIEEEGQGIARRSRDRHRKFPSRKYGFEVHKDDNGHKSYTAKTEEKVKLQALFSEAQEVEGHRDYAELLINQASLLKKGAEDVARILFDPFYCGCEMYGEHFNRLSHVEQIVTIEDFQKAHEVIDSFQSVIRENLDARKDEVILKPKCGYCRDEMKYKRSKVGDSGIFSCSCKSQKVELGVDDYNRMLLHNAQLMVDSLQLGKIKNKAYKLIDKKSEHHENLIHEISKTIETLQYEIAALSPEEALASRNRRNSALAKLMDAKDRRKDIRDELLLLENHKVNLQYIVKKVSNLVSKEEVVFMVSHLIKDCYMFHEVAEMDFYYNEFLDIQELERKILHDNQSTEQQGA